MSTQRHIVLRAFPVGAPRPSDFAIELCELRPLPADHVQVENHYLSMDPAPRLRMDPQSGAHALQLGQTVIGRGAGIVRASNHPAFQRGDWVIGELGWQEVAMLPGDQLRKWDAATGSPSSALGVLGPSGIAAWCLVNIAAPVTRAATVAVTAAAGAVGSVVLQLARLAGARTVALVAGEGQRDFVSAKLGADLALNVRAPSFGEDLAHALRDNGIDIVFDSVGGDLHNTLMSHLNDHARIIAYGYISRYNESGAERSEYGRIYQLIHKRAHLSGFLVRDHSARFGEAMQELSRLHAAGSLAGHEQILDGLEQVPNAFAALFSADPLGKQLVRLIHPPQSSLESETRP
jgi:NADPH-dependent curcumin reductase CurA